MQPQQLSHYILNGESELIYQHASQEFQQAISLNDLQAGILSFRDGIHELHLQSKLLIDNETEYTWVDEAQTKGVLAIFNSENRITGLQFLPLETYPQTDKRWTKNTYAFPMKGCWLTFWGGTNELANYHYPYASQRYAYDFVVMENHQTYKGNPNNNENYFTFGQEVVAPTAGKIVEIENDMIDNIPGEMNEENPSGNYVVIDHGHNEYSILVHFKQYSIVVKEGDYVQSGEVLGLCGNSGYSTEAHIHYQVSDSPDIDHGNAIRIRFHHKKEPIRGDFINAN